MWFLVFSHSNKFFSTENTVVWNGFSYLLHWNKSGSVNLAVLNYGYQVAEEQEVNPVFIKIALQIKLPWMKEVKFKKSRARNRTHQNQELIETVTPWIYIACNSFPILNVKIQLVWPDFQKKNIWDLKVGGGVSAISFSNFGNCLQNA